MKKYLILIAATVLFNACSSNDEPEPPMDPERTVLIYMAGENNLSEFVSKDLKEMKEGSKSLDNRHNLIVYVDQANSIPPYFARIKDGKIVDSVSVKESLTADPAVLEEALRYTRTTYPAKSYGLVLWGHGSGWLVSNDSIVYAKSRAYGGDMGNNSPSRAGNYWMNIPSMSRAIANAMGGEKLTFVFGDCCNFNCIETDYELRNVADYVIGSPAEIPEPGAPYHLIVPDLFNTSENFYRSIIDHYYNYYLEEFKERPTYYYNIKHGDLAGYSEPLAAVKTAALEELAQATARLLSTIPDKLSPEGVLDLVNVTYWGYDRSSSKRFAYDICYTLKRNTAEADYKTWESVFKKAVPYSTYSAHWLTDSSQLRTDMLHFDATADDCGVVSMFFPNQIYRSSTPNWNTAIQKFQWNSVIRWEQYGW